MDSGNWIYVPDVDEDRPWTGRIWDEGDSKSRWRFELIRHADLSDIYSTSPFAGAAPVSGLLDHQRPCTIIRPLVTRIDPGKSGQKFPFLRTRIEGSCQAFLTGLAIEDETAEDFAGIGFESPAFAAWYGGRSFSTVSGATHRTERIETIDEAKEPATIAGLGEVEATRIASVKDDHHSSIVKTRTILRIVFDRQRSLSEAMDICLGLEFLFGFLVGFRSRPPLFHLWQQRDPEAEDVSRDAELQIGGVNWSPGEPPHPFERLHMAGRGGVGLATVLERFAANSSDFVTRIHAIESSRFFATTLNDKFAHVMPVFEQYLKATYAQADEDSYASKEQAFFDWVDQSADPDIPEFSKKHIQVVKRKAPSLQTLIARAIASLNTEGFRFGENLAKRIASRRAAMFHSAPLMEKADVRSFYIEVRAVTFMLLLHTLRDIGVPLAPMAEEYHALSDFVPFLKKGPWDAGSTDED